VVTGKKVAGGRAYFEGDMDSCCPFVGGAETSPACAVVVVPRCGTGFLGRVCV
jgi:hypothetical protein